MIQDINTICLALPLHVNTVNCFLLRTDNSWILIDTACSIRRKALEARIRAAGCGPGELGLIILTHGDFDHTGNAKYLRETYATKVAMHRDDLGMVEHGDMFWNRGKSNKLVKVVAPILFGFGKNERFAPDLYLDDRIDLSGYGADLRIVHLPGHSSGSVGVLTGNKGLFCGDLLINEKKPVINYRIDDPVAARNSVDRLREMEIETVFPSHGRQFRFEELCRTQSRNGLSWS
jgi:hydroxyacylglutathione hydrolase